MKSNLYAAILLVLLAITAFLTGSYVCRTTQTMQSTLVSIHQTADAGDYATARALLQELLVTAKKKTQLLTFLVRRSQLDKMNETLATLPYYAQADNAADLSVELFRAYEQLEQIKRSFIAAF